MPIETRLSRSLDIDHPVVQAPIGSASTPELAAAVSNAGGLGTLAISWRDPEEIRTVVDATRDLTHEPFAVNLVLDSDTGVAPVEDLLPVALEADVPLVSLSFGDPEPHVDRIHDADASVLVTVGSAADAERAVAARADVVVAQGWEAGGHVQSGVATMPLVPRVADATPADVPVVAAGGIADGRGLAAALALGADGVWLGTRFVAAAESGAHDEYKQSVADADADETVYGEPFSKGWRDQPHRTLATGTTDRWEAEGRPPLERRPDGDETVAWTPDDEPVERYADLPPLAGMEGDVAALPQYAGQSAGAVREVVPAEQLVTELVDEAAKTVQGLAASVRGRDGS